MSITEYIKPYLYKRRKNALIRPFNSADNNPPVVKFRVMWSEMFI